MKTFLIALFILALTVSFVVWNAWDLNRTAETLSALTRSLPEDAASFHKDAQTESTLAELYGLWDRKFERIAFTVGYNNCNRADEALLSLIAHYRNESAEDFTHARLLLLDSLRRLRVLEGISPESIL
ncbi:MAG: hypothetical protein IJV98_05720 [Clostridia bacterium]|nr:hypothetical protein [Clostridia bacterium]